jgi:argininosuccinate synthase
MDRIVLAYSGGLETSAAISWLAGKYRAEVVTLTLDVGQGSTLDDVRERALAIGAVRAHVLDAREDFARRFVLPALQAGALGHGGDPLAAALTRPLIARKLVEIAHIEGAKAIAHGDHRFGSAPGAIDRSVAAIDPAIKVIPLAQAWGQSRAQLIPYAKERGIPIPPNVDRSYHTDANLWGRSIQCGLLVDAWQDVPEDLFAMAKSADDAPDRPAFVEIQFEHGEPVKLNGIAMSLVELIQSLETIAGAHAIGRADRSDGSVEGAASREIYDAPAATVLAMAHQDLQQVVTEPDLQRLSADLGVTYADLVRHGQWDTRTREAIDALVANVQRQVTGAVRLKLHKGDCRVAGRRAAGEVRSTKLEVRSRKATEATSR